MPHYLFGIICFLFLIFRLIKIYMEGGNLKIPYYVQLLGLFTLYTLLSSFLVSDLLMDTGTIKYLYSDYFLLTFIAFLIIENTHFPARWIHIAIRILGLTLVLAAIISVVQIYKPLFFLRTTDVIEGLPYERLGSYYRDNPVEETNSVSRFLGGYRLSIYSYINELSVGIDTLAIFSILIALKSTKRIRIIIWVIAAGLVSFLSSSRWIMLNFLVISSQFIWTRSTWFSNSIKYIFYGVILMIFMGTIAKYSGIDLQDFTEDRLFSNSALTRLVAVEVFSEVFPDHPFFGTGGVDTPEMERLIKGRSSQIHVGYLKLFYYYGLIGGLLYLGFLISFMIRLWQMARRSNYWGGFFAVLAFAIANITLVELDLFYHGLILAFIFSNHYYYKNITQATEYQGSSNKKLIAPHGD